MKKTVRIDMPFIFNLKMQIPSGKNAVQTTRTGKRYPSKRFKVWRDAAIQSLPDRLPRFDGPVAVVVDYSPGDKIRRDVPGLLDALCHLIEKVGIVNDDAQVKNVTWTTFPVWPKKPRCTVSIYELRHGGEDATKD